MIFNDMLFEQRLRWSNVYVYNNDDNKSSRIESRRRQANQRGQWEKLIGEGGELSSPAIRGPARTWASQGPRGTQGSRGFESISHRPILDHLTHPPHNVCKTFCYGERALHSIGALQARWSGLDYWLAGANRDQRSEGQRSRPNQPPNRSQKIQRL